MASTLARPFDSFMSGFAPGQGRSAAGCASLIGMPTRRELLKFGALGGAALVVGIRWEDKAFAVGKPSAAFAPNVWVRIDGAGRTYLTIGKSEMGQGVRTSLAMILTDELDAD